MSHPDDIEVRRHRQSIGHGRRGAKVSESLAGTAKILGLITNPDVRILCEPRVAMNRHGMAAHEQILNLGGGEFRKQIDQVGGEGHRGSSIGTIVPQAP
jgi:hypothetical protein